MTTEGLQVLMMTRFWAGLFLCCLTASLTASADEATVPYRYWPLFERPATILTAGPVASREHAILLETVSGLAAKHVGETRELVWTPNPHPSYARWFRMMREQTGAVESGPHNVWDLVKRFREKGFIKGYVLYRYDASARGFFEPGPMDTSVNVATMLCGLLSCVAVSEGLEARAQELGLTRLFDARTLSEAACYERHAVQLSPRFLALQDPKAQEIRSLAVAVDAPVLSEPGSLYETILAQQEADTPVLGWAIGDEAQITMPSSRLGHFQTATNWCHNLCPLSTETPGGSYPADKLRLDHNKTIWDMDWDADVHYVSFVMSDGDNVQWLMGDFCEDSQRCYWSNANRGTFPIGWTSCYSDLAQLCPYTIDYLASTRTRNDDFLLFGGGYYYPDLYGANRPEKDLVQLHARRMAGYMRLGGIRLMAVNCQKWDRPAAVDAYTAFAEELDGLLAIYAIQYAPYTAGGGAIKWVKDKRGDDVPAVSARFSIWNNVRAERDGNPTVTARCINAMMHAGAPESEQHFSCVIVHAWSWFKPPQPGAPDDAQEIDQKLGGQPETGRGVDAVKWCVDQLAPHVRAVTPSELALLIRLRLRPEQTIRRALDTLSQTAQTGGGGYKLDHAYSLLKRGDYEGAFAAGKRAALVEHRIAKGENSEFRIQKPAVWGWSAGSSR